ncbi:MAG: methyltransferase [Boseongicola sp.]|nr:methyltransferase [Boseongicola sp.]MDD9976624.1 methyltransferase [Boseongicola sp.]
MALADQHPVPQKPRQSWRQRLVRLTASRGFQKWAARFPLTKGITRREGEAIFDLVAGFVHSQCLQAMVALGILEMLIERPLSAGALSSRTRVPEDRLRVLLNAGIALSLLRQDGDVITLTTRGAALVGVPGLSEMIKHHDVLYRDLVDPVAFFRGETDTELSEFWPYVFGAGAATDPETTTRYSKLMSDSQTLVAEETLAVVSLDAVSHIMDVGGGTGAFLEAALEAHPNLTGTLFDLPAVAPAADKRFAEAGLDNRATVRAGSFRDDPLPEGADAISLVRVLYDHEDTTVSALLDTIYNVLPVGGRLIISEPMAGSNRPSRAGDAYFAIYTLAMGTGRTRTAHEIAALMRKAGFARVSPVKTTRPFVTSVVTGVKN